MTKGITIVGQEKVKINSGGGPGADGLESPTSTIGSGPIGGSGNAQEPESPGGADNSASGPSRAQEPERPAGADNSKSGQKSCPC
jgi:hypothetical protein